MRRGTGSAFLVAAILFVLLMPLWSSPAAAQQGSVELGIDMGFSFSDLAGGGEVVGFSLPIQRFRVGGFFSRRVELEAALTLDVIDVEDVTFTEFGFAGGLAFHLAADPEKVRFFVEPVAVFQLADVEIESVSQFRVGGLLGIKVPLTDVLGFRLDAGYLRAFESEDLPAANEIVASLGLSFFLD